MIRLLFALLLTPTFLWAERFEQDRFPRLANVINVASNDFLNIRINPDHTSEVLGTLDPDAINIEIIAHDKSGQWGLINSNESSGWVRLNFLNTPKQAKWHAFKTPLECYGTEPFWDFRITADATNAFFHDIEDAVSLYEIDWHSDIQARLGGTIGLGAGDHEHGFSAIIENASCNDGMSDRESALRLRLFVHRKGGSVGYDGCCALAP